MKKLIARVMALLGSLIALGLAAGASFHWR
ncbi:hypothetical protein Ththe16_1385 [Thermus thermophilus SG0.5JP17-16]|uniref:Uncharacterized protein n=1 Tax=Thermus thermophilus (strain SG0.5JP17-16) TaxID=762633 RepID=F6DIF9_THETG|nr:hypothetical protein Ththe16_1385 [Thermus thermophilus SG0.5JP17-16]